MVSKEWYCNPFVNFVPFVVKNQSVHHEEHEEKN
jgi:hypothetical protein